MKKLALAIMVIGNVLANPTILQVKYKNIVVNGKTAKVMTITQPDGTWGYFSKSGTNFNVIVQNKLDQPTVIHWHGLSLPNKQDGTELTQMVIAPHSQYKYDFKLKNAGTFWMHSHYKLQSALFAEAPLIIETPQDKLYQQVVVMFQDFSFKSPEQILHQLQTSKKSMDMSSMPMQMSMQTKPAKQTTDQDLNDVKHDAYLTNYHTLQHPQITIVKDGGAVKLRFINGSASSNFWINLGSLSGEAVAVDGHAIKPIYGNRFQLAIAQRMDIIIHIPPKGGSFAILGQVEGLKDQTGLILTTNAKLKPMVISSIASNAASAVDNQQELNLQSIEKLPNKKISRVIKYVLTGDMSKYVWKINNQTWPNITPAIVKQGERVELDFINKTMMSHPMHLHGYGFKIISINGKRVDGAIRDTVLVPPNSDIKVVFDATEPGKWLVHCHLLYHMPNGMMTYLEVIPEPEKKMVSRD